jgi:DNA polymerase-1
VGPVSAASLIAKHGSLENLLASGRFAVQAENLLRYKAVATMDKAAPLPPLRNQKPTWNRAAKLARDWDLNKLAERLEALAGQAG